jgi:hypothetical protein
MSRAFEELDRRRTTIGEISLRRRLEPTLQVDVFEVNLDDPPDHDFVDVLREVFETVSAQIVSFPNFHTGGEASITVYVTTAPTEP